MLGAVPDAAFARKGPRIVNQADAIIGSLSEFLGLLISSGHAGPDLLVLVVLTASGVALAAIHGSIGARLIRVGLLVRNVRSLCEERATDTHETLLRDLDRTFAGSLLADSWAELLQRRREFEAYAPEDRAPIQLADLLIDRPLIPIGIRRRAMKMLPSLLSVLGFATTLGMLAGELGSAATGTSTASILGLSLRGTFWGVAMGTVAAAVATVLEGAADALTTRLSLLVGQRYRSLTAIEAQLCGTEAQRLGFKRVSSLLVQVAQDIRDSLDRGLERIEWSTANAANLIGEKQRRILKLAVKDLSYVLRRGVADQVGPLRSSLQQTAQQQSATDDRGGTMNDPLASGTIAGSAAELKPLVIYLGEIATVLERTARRVERAELQLNPGDRASAAMLSALHDDIARTSSQFLDGSIALRRSVEPIREQQETQTERDIAQALANFAERADALRQHLDEYDLEHDDLDGNDVDAASQVVALDIEFEPERDPETRAMRRGGDLASVLARSGEGLEAGEHREGQPSPETPRVQAEGPVREEVAETDVDPIGRVGFSALLSRYDAPQFSIDELSEDLREFSVGNVKLSVRDPSLNNSDEVADRHGNSPTAARKSAVPTDPATNMNDDLITNAEDASTNEDAGQHRRDRSLASE